MKLFRFIAQNLSRVEYLRGQHRDEEARAVCDQITQFVKDNLPSGSGFDTGTHLDWDLSKPEKLVFNTEFHHMNDAGYYDGWTSHSVIVTPSLITDFKLRVTGVNRRDIKDYIGDTFHHIMERDEDFKFLV